MPNKTISETGYKRKVLTVTWVQNDEGVAVQSVQLFAEKATDAPGMSGRSYSEDITDKLTATMTKNLDGLMKAGGWVETYVDTELG